MKLEKPKNPNYAATVVELSRFEDLPNCANLKAAILYGNAVIVSKHAMAGEVGLFFPIEAQLSHEFLAQNNLYRKPEWGNVNQTQKGFFEAHGRVKAAKFRGNKSEGFWIPITALTYCGIPLDEFRPGMEFDKIGEHEICKKYIPQRVRVAGSGGANSRRIARVEDLVVEGQFRFHTDTENLRKNIHKIKPEMWITISDKWHGTSAVYANILVQRELPWYERLLKHFGVRVVEQEYGFVWSSRRVVKGINSEPKANAVHFYSEDIWGAVAGEIKNRIPKGYTIYGEIVGYTGDGAPIQKDYSYGCPPGEHRFVVYRITQTNVDGLVVEFSWQQMEEFCTRNNFEMVKELWQGRAGDFEDGLEGRAEWHDEFLQALEADLVEGRMCSYNKCAVPAEGIVLKVDCLDENMAFKLKNFAFLSRESESLDAGIVDIETGEDVP